MPLAALKLRMKWSCDRCTSPARSARPSGVARCASMCSVTRRSCRGVRTGCRRAPSVRGSAPRPLRARQRTAPRCAVAPHEVMRQQVLALREQQRIGARGHAAVQLHLAHQHLEEALQPRVVDREEGVDLRRRAEVFLGRDALDQRLPDVQVHHAAAPADLPFGAVAGDEAHAAQPRARGDELAALVLAHRRAAVLVQHQHVMRRAVKGQPARVLLPAGGEQLVAAGHEVLGLRTGARGDDVRGETGCNVGCDARWGRRDGVHRSFLSCPPGARCARRVQAARC